MRNLLWHSAVKKTMRVHPKLISLIRINGLEYIMNYSLIFRMNWTKSLWDSNCLFNLDEVFGASLQESIRTSGFICNGCILDRISL